MFASLIALAAYFVRGIAGFGSALVASPLLAQMLPLSIVVPLVVILDNSGSVLQAWRHRRLIVWADLRPLLPFSFVGITLAMVLHAWIDGRLLKLLLGLFVVLFGAYQFLPQPNVHLSRRWAAPAGLLGGLVGGLFGTGGPFYVMYFRLRQLEKTVFLATIAMLWVVDGGLRIAGFALGGHYQEQHLWLLAAMAPTAWLGLHWGQKLHFGISATTFRHIIGALLLASGGMLLWRQS
ncbi:sulfite exporter TauE/SafE family protein [Sulfuricystis multivorans]|uniref:sulfite exporter TauE/SafE family protein n=1 Tax=Sulfuricystis multivorans TaxID=2211108 RepID=UPI001559B39E|nr:sulfite exporter TauE/SafE family protein [Sulfuricystis multivorans]